MVGRSRFEKLADEELTPRVYRATERLCMTCVHLGPGGSRANTCAAFPGGIPTPILTNQFDHRRPWDGGDGWPSDGGIRYEPSEP